MNLGIRELNPENKNTKPENKRIEPTLKSPPMKKAAKNQCAAASLPARGDFVLKRTRFSP